MRTERRLPNGDRHSRSDPDRVQGRSESIGLHDLHGNGNDCRVDCTVIVDLIVDPVEECDDGNGVNADGCENDFTVTMGATLYPCFDASQIDLQPEVLVSSDCTDLLPDTQAVSGFRSGEDVWLTAASNKGNASSNQCLLIDEFNGINESFFFITEEEVKACI